MSFEHEIKVHYKKTDCSIEEEQEMLDEIFEILFSEIIRDLTITGV